MIDENFWTGRKTLVTGHTGFKGCWLTLLLSRLGAHTHGYATAPPTSPALFTEARLNRFIVDRRADITEREEVRTAIQKSSPEIIFHLAAQPLVRTSYEDPLLTFNVNALGTANLLQACLEVTPKPKAVVVVTSDKCYENKEWVWPYRETDALGGFDPYSASKGCAELISNAYKKSFFESSNIGLATARAGNVIGGGDWAQNRLVPDAFRSIQARKKLTIRYPDAVRPWQHVLDPLAGYLLLAQHLTKEPTQFSTPWNFGPIENRPRTVRWVLEQLSDHWPTMSWTTEITSQPDHEANLLTLDPSKAVQRLNWIPQMTTLQSIKATANWYTTWLHGDNIEDLTIGQVDEYLENL